MHYNGTEINTNIQYQYLHAHDKMMDVTHHTKDYKFDMCCFCVKQPALNSKNKDWLVHDHLVIKM